MAKSPPGRDEAGEQLIELRIPDLSNVPWDELITGDAFGTALCRALAERAPDEHSAFSNFI